MTMDPAVAAALRKVQVKTAIFVALLASILIGGSGRTDWIAGWAYLLIVSLGPLAIYRTLVRKSPDLLLERSKLQRGKKPWDKVLAPLIAGVFPPAMWIVGALYHRYAWSRIAWMWQAAGFLLIVPGIYLMHRAMSVNRFFAATVRIQKDRGQTVVSNGPYAHVRHPGYVGLLGYVLGTPLALGSTYAAIPAGLCAATVVLRTALEDRTLRAELDGYAEYARRVRSRLIPLVW